MCFHSSLATQIVYKNHSCVPSAYSKICILENFHYDEEETHVIHSFPANLHHVRITRETRSVKGPVRTFDVNAKLHTMLGRPAILEMQGYAMWHLELPRALQQGIFPKLYIPNLTVEPGTDIPNLVYLDLSYNYLRNIANVSALINLEVLLLGENYINSIEPTTFQNLTKLRILNLGNNYLTKVALNIYPKSLTELNLFSCKIKSLNYRHLYYPSMEVLNIEQNKLTSIDGSALLLAMPKLKTIRIGWNLFEREELQEALEQFQRHNISIRDEADEAACYFNEQVVQGVCITDHEPPRGVMREILMTVVVIVVAIALGATLRWGFVSMKGGE